MSQSVLLVDDDSAFCYAMAKALGRFGCHVDVANSGEEALEHLRKKPSPDVTFVDLKMGGIGGMEVLKRSRGHKTKFVVLTGHGTVQLAVEAMQLGAFSFLEKPVDAEELMPLIDQISNESTEEPSSTIELIGDSNRVSELIDFIDRIGPTDDTVMVYGETGTGKELVAHRVHSKSPRADKSFVAMNAACVPRELFESELFGHVKGAFTGATSDRIGLFQQADHGTLFIDEIAEMPVESQAKLLRAIETKMIRPVGAAKEVSVDVRIIAATNRDLWEETRSGRFREDLFFRLQVFPISVPALRERKEDLPALCRDLLHRIRRPDLELTPEALQALMNYHWPGNVRELLNVLRRAALFSDSRAIDEKMVTNMIMASVFSRADNGAGAARTRTDSPQSLAELEREHIERVMSDSDGNVSQAASALGIDRRTLQRKLRAWEMED